MRNHLHLIVVDYLQLIVMCKSLSRETKFQIYPGIKGDGKELDGR